ncbi:MAG: aminodeoxychorismate lyase [Pseudohongiellaceae bacterium]
MQTLINGSPKNEVSVMDRGFLYGDGAFETLRVQDGRVILLEQHLKRLQRACHSLKIKFDDTLVLDELIQLCKNSRGNMAAKIIITRGAGGRGYTPPYGVEGTRILQLFDQSPLTDANEEGISVTVCQHRLSQSTTLAGIKHLNRLDQVLASSELMGQYDEGLCLDVENHVIEGTKSNILLRLGDQIFGADLSKSGVHGIMLEELIRGIRAQGRQVITKNLTLDDIFNAEELVFCNSVAGISPVIKLTESDRVKHWPIGNLFHQAIKLKNDAFAST